MVVRANKEDKLEGGEKEGISSDKDNEEPPPHIPTFEGSDPLGWIARAEKFF